MKTACNQHKRRLLLLSQLIKPTCSWAQLYRQDRKLNTVSFNSSRDAIRKATVLSKEKGWYILCLSSTCMSSIPFRWDEHILQFIRMRNRWCPSYHPDWLKCWCHPSSAFLWGTLTKLTSAPRFQQLYSREKQEVVPK